MKKWNKDFCCDQMTTHLKEFFQTDESIDNPDVIIKYIPKFDEYGIPIYDGGSSMIEIKFCPWCGSKLPDSKRDLWFDRLIELGIDYGDEKLIPEEYKTGRWYEK